MWLGGSDGRAHEPTILPGICAALAAISAALAIGASRDGRGSPESRTGWIWLASGAGTVLLLSASPHGAHGVERLIASSLLGATAGDAGLFAMLAVASAALALLLRRQLAVLAIDPRSAAMVGIDRRWWEPVIAIWLGLCIGLAIRVSGLLFAFGCLVLPALAARGLCREVRSQFVVAPALALVAAMVGFAIANHHDLPPAQVAVGILCAIPVVTAAIGWLRDRLGGVRS
jgi:ABC-type Mn2+/Zn2+ transport system permease subunit